MAVSKLTFPVKQNDAVLKINEIIDDVTGIEDNYVTTNTAQNISGTKTFVGQKKIGFKQSGSSDKLGFTLYNNSGTEKGYLEYNPSNLVDSVPLMTLGNYASSAAAITHVGFRKYSSISGASGAYNLLAPLISDARTPFNLTTTYTNFYLPLGFTDGTNTVLTAKSGLVNISSLLPSLSGYATETWVGQQGYAVASSLATVATSGSYADLIDTPTIPTVNNATLTITQGGVSKGTFTANASSDVTIDLDAGGGGSSSLAGLSDVSLTSLSSNQVLAYDGSEWINNGLKTINSQDIVGSGNLSLADTTLSNVSSIDSNSAVQTALNSKQDSSTAVTHTASTAVGNSTTPVYINSSGAATALSYTIAKSVPSDAVFTDTTYSDFTGATSIAGGAAGLVPAPSSGDNDKILTGGATWSALKTVNSTSLLGSGDIATPDTKNTAGSTDTSSKIFLIGATSQAANPQTYSQDTTFVDTNGRLNSAAPANDANDTTVATTKWVKDQGYTTNTGTVTSVNNVSPVSGNVTLSIPASISNLTDDTATYPIDKADTLTGLTASITELNYTDGVTSNIQTQLDGKLSTKPDGTNNLIDSNNKVNVSYMPDVVLGQMLYAGTFVPTTAVATLSTNAKIILGTTSDTITLTNDTSAITGYTANEGNYYIASGDGTFASISFLTGDWLVATADGWGKILNTDAVTGVKGNAESTYRTGNVNITADNVLPSQSSQSGKFLTTNGSTASWGSITGLPSQASQSGKYLTTNGTTASWVSLSIPTTTDSVTSGSSAALTSGGAYTNLVTAVAAHSTDANKINVTKAGSTSTITINDVAHATSADSATSATSATTASKLGSSDVGSATQPIFLDDGVATACTYTLAKSVPSDAVFTDTNTLMTQNVSSTNATYPILLCPTANATVNQGAKTGIFASGVKVNPSTNTISATFSGNLTGNVTGDCSGSSGSCIGNAATATTASKLGSSTVGGTTTPIYLDGGTPTALSYTIAKSVPSNAVFTDTTYANGTGITIGTGNAINHSNSVTAATAGTSSATSGSTLAVPYVTYDAQGHVTASGTHTHTVTGFATSDTQNTCGAGNSTSKLYLVGRTAQSTGTSNSNSSVYTQSGYLYATTPASTTNDTTVATTKFVKDQGYTSNTGTVTSVNNVSPVNGNVTLSIPTVDQTYNSTSANAQSGVAIAGAGFLQVKGAITSSTTLTTLEEGIYTVDGVTHSGFPDTSQAFYGVLIQYGGTYKPQLLVAGMPSVGGLYHRRYLTASSSFTGWVRCGNAATGTNSFTMGGTPSSATSSVNVGIASTAGGGYSTAIGYYSASNGARSTSIGYGARIGASTADAIQIGNGTNSTAKSLSVGFYNTANYTLLDGTTGLIPDARISSNIMKKTEVWYDSTSSTLYIGVAQS